MKLKLTTYILKLILVLTFICGLFDIMDYGLVYGQNANLTVSADVRTDTMTFNPQGSAPASPVDGQIYYNSATKQLYYYDASSSTWKSFGLAGLDKAVATKIVAASNSLGTTCSGTCSNPKADYTCDGTDDQQEINKAINNLPTDGGAVYLLEGTYNISTALLEGETLKGIVPHNNTAIIGTGKGTVLKLVSGVSNVNVINASNVSRILISQLMIDGNNRTGSNNGGILFSAVTYSKIDKVWVENMSRHGIGLNPLSSNNTISNNNVQGNGLVERYSGIFLEGACNNTVSHNNVQGNGQGITLWTPSNNNIISDNNIQNNSQYGIHLNACSNNTISNNNVQGNTSDGGIYLSVSCSNNTISNNNVQGNTQKGIYLESTCSNNTISNNNVQGNTQEGVYLENTSNNNTITGNVLYGNGLSLGGGGAADSIRISSGNKNIISANRIYSTISLGSSGYGIEISGSDNYVAGNFIYDTDIFFGPSYDMRIKDNGTNTRYTDKAKLSFEPGSYSGLVGGQTLTPTEPTSYLRLAPSGQVLLNATTSIANGNSAGSLLILENTTTFEVRLYASATLKLHTTATTPPSLSLYKNDFLALIWDGSRWLEVGFKDN